MPNVSGANRVLLAAGNGNVYDRAVLDADAAPCTKIHIDTAGAFFYFDGKVSGRSFHRFKICVGDNFDV